MCRAGNFRWKLPLSAQDKRPKFGIKKKQNSYPVLLRYYKKTWKHVSPPLIPSILENHLRLQPSTVIYRPLCLFQALPNSFFKYLHLQFCISNFSVCLGQTKLQALWPITPFLWLISPVSSPQISEQKLSGWRRGNPEACLPCCRCSIKLRWATQARPQNGWAAGMEN